MVPHPDPPPVADARVHTPGDARMHTPAPVYSPFVRAAVATTAVAAAVAVFGTAVLLGPALLMALLALVLGTAALPAVDRLSRILPRRVAAVIVLGGGLLVVAGSISLAIPHLTTQFGSLVDQLPVRCQSLKLWSTAHDGGGLSRKMLAELMPQTCSTVISSLPKRVAGWRSLTWIEDTLWVVLVVAAMAYWWLLERSVLLGQLNLLFRADARQRAHAFIEEAEVRVGAFVRGQLIICALVGVVTFAVYLIGGLPTPLALAGLAAVAELVPIVGPPVAAIAAIISAPHAWPIILLLAVIIRILVDYAVTPFVMGRAVGVNALLVLTSLLALSKFGGIAGAMVAVPFAAIVQLAINHWILQAAVDRTDGGRDRASALRYRATALGVAARKLARRRAVAPGAVEIQEEVELIVEGLTNWLRPVEPADGKQMSSQ